MEEKKKKNIFISARNREAAFNKSKHYENDLLVDEKNSLINFSEYDEISHTNQHTVTCQRGELQALQYLQGLETTLAMLQKYQTIENFF